MEDSLARRWYEAFVETVQARDSRALRGAAESGALGEWTAALTAAIVSTFPRMGWQGAARGHRLAALPVAREEYLALDVVAFDTTGARRWRFPIAVFELENSQTDDRVAYSLWKVLCVRAGLRVVFCYRQDASAGADLVGHLGDEVIRSMALQERSTVGGETLLVVGTRSERSSFPYGFFKGWALDSNSGRFRRD